MKIREYPIIKKQSIFKKNKIAIIIALIGILAMSIVSILNLDLFIRALHSYQNETLSLEKFRLDLASYNIGQPIHPIPYGARISPKDSMIQVFVPEGEFTMGRGHSGSTLSHTVYLDAFWMDRVEVTNTMYLKCMSAGICTTPASVNIYYDKWAYRNHPIVYISWYQARDYCQWAQRRLPTEAEWEKSACGTDKRPYPWGFENPNPRLANFEKNMIHEAVPVFRYPLGASPYGVLNMSGNVREWIADWYDPNYYTISPYANPQGPDSGDTRSLRSGSYDLDWSQIAVYTRFHHKPESPGLSRGFRCVQDS